MNSAFHSQFTICSSCDIQDTEYDYQSVMHYSSWAFSNNGLDTIVKKDGSSIDSRSYTQLGLSCLDIVGINKHYTCGNILDHWWVPSRAPWQYFSSITRNLIFLFRHEFCERRVFSHNHICLKHGGAGDNRRAYRYENHHQVIFKHSF